jgi:hypothetical protein
VGLEREGTPGRRTGSDDRIRGERPGGERRRRGRFFGTWTVWAGLQGYVPTLAGPRGMSLRDTSSSPTRSRGPRPSIGAWTGVMDGLAESGFRPHSLAASLAKGPHSFRVRAWESRGEPELPCGGGLLFRPVPPDAPLLNLSVGGRLVEDGAWLAERSGRIEVAKAASLPATLPLPGGSRKEGMSYVWRTRLRPNGE